MAPSRLAELSAAITENTRKLEAYYQQHELPIPSFDEDGPHDTVLSDPVAEDYRCSIIEASIELKQLLEGPVMLLRPVLNATALQAFYKFDIPSKVPTNGEISYEDLAKQCGLETQLVRRIVRFGIVHHRCFQEKREGYVSHSAASRLLHDSSDAMSGVAMGNDDTYHAFAHTVEAIEKYPQPDPAHCGWTLAWGKDVPIFKSHAADPIRGPRTAKAMREFSRGFGHDFIALKNYDWASLDAKGARVVDVGGASGQASILVAQSHHNLRFEVQDLSEIVTSSRDDIPAALADRITYRTHDFFTPQTEPADAFLLRQVLHDWPDSEAVKMLKALIPGLKSGSKVIVNDIVVYPPGTMRHMAEMHMSHMDLIVMSLLSAKEREKRDWERLFEEADRRFVDITFSPPNAGVMAVIEATWSG